MIEKNDFKSKKVVIKISSNLLNPDLDFDIIKKLAQDISILIKNNFNVIIVTSGAVMHGVKILKYDKKPTLMPLLQSAASIGQIQLMAKYRAEFERHDLITAQILVSMDDFRIRKRYLNLRNTVEALLEIGAIPIFNENDSVNTEELKFGDNDQLSALLTVMVDFDTLIILTDVNGLYDKDPNENNDAKLIERIDDLDEKYFNYTSSKVSKFSSGGMFKKLESAFKAAKGGVNVFIGNGFNASILNIVKQEEIGTYISASPIKTNARKKWLGLSPTHKGEVIIDKGALKALLGNSSLLASGITNVNGSFVRGSLINIIHDHKKIAQGLTNYSSKEIDLIKGRKSSEFGSLIKNSDYIEVIHKNNIVLL